MNDRIATRLQPSNFNDIATIKILRKCIN